jgi:hypothetical protein
MLKMAILVADFDMMSTDALKTLGNSMCSLFSFRRAKAVFHFQTFRSPYYTCMNQNSWLAQIQKRINRMQERFHEQATSGREGWTWIGAWWPWSRSRRQGRLLHPCAQLPAGAGTASVGAAARGEEEAT